MKYLLIITSVILVVSSSSNDSWEKFKLNYGKYYESWLEEEARFAIFQNNLRIIDQHNQKYEKGEVFYKLGVNKFADISAEEFAAGLNGLREYELNSENASVFSYTVNAVEVPQKIDWREDGIVPGAKDQGNCDGSFYFAAVGILEIYNYLSTGDKVDFSEQCLIDCSLGYNDGCNSGGVLNSLDYIRNAGVAYEEDYPYKGVLGQCESTSRNLKSFGYRIIPKGTEALKEAVGTIGPIAVSFDGSNLQLYSSGVFHNLACNKEISTQSGIVVGYDRTRTQDYWIIKLSFGSGWGEEGYVRMVRDADDVCGISANAIYPLL